MPKRSNEFQRLVRRIYEQLAPEGARVIESALIKERESSIEREIDVLIEHTVADALIRIAVECTKPSRASSIGWIDQLIGKYRDLPIDRIIAVAGRGFSRAAAEKASANRIDLRTFKKALDTDWPSELVRVGIGRVTLELKPCEFGLRTEPRWSHPLPPVAITLADGTEVPGTEFFDGVTGRLRPLIADYFFSKVAREGRSVAELNGTLDQTFDVVADQVICHASSGSTHRLLSLS